MHIKYHIFSEKSRQKIFFCNKQTAPWEGAFSFEPEILIDIGFQLSFWNFLEVVSNTRIKGVAGIFF